MEVLRNFNDLFFIFCLQVRAMSKSLKRQSSDACIPQSLKKKEKQLTKMLFIIFVCFMLTYLPAFVVKRVSFIINQNFEFIRANCGVGTQCVNYSDQHCTIFKNSSSNRSASS